MIMWCYPNIISYQYAQQMYIINVLPIKFLLHQGYTSKKQKLFQDKRANQLHLQTQGQEFGKSWNRNRHLNVVRHIDKQLNYWQLPIKNKCLEKVQKTDKLKVSYLQAFWVVPSGLITLENPWRVQAIVIIFSRSKELILSLHSLYETWYWKM